MIENPLAPLISKDTEILILGSMPSSISIQRQQYYANPTNHFWELVGLAIDEDLEGLPYNNKIEIIERHRIGLWDAYMRCERDGSYDSKIKDAIFNDFRILKDRCPELKLVCFNGKAAQKARKKIESEGHKTITLPSSSAANRRYHKRRIDAWKSIISC